MSSAFLANHKTCHWRGILAAAAVLIQSGCSVFGIRSAEEASYVVLDEQDEFQLREYAGLVVAVTTVKAEFDDAGNEAFGRLFGYISGENQTNQKVSMTAPVLASEEDGANGESIEMTAPVIADQEADGWRYAFVLPNSYTLANAPIPTNPEVKLVQVEPKLVAVLRFSGSWNETDFRTNSDRLLLWISENQLESASSPRVAGYDPPWTIPFLRRNEVMIDVRS